jgi:hypothetical protein
MERDKLRIACRKPMCALRFGKRIGLQEMSLTIKVSYYFHIPFHTLLFPSYLIS